MEASFFFVVSAIASLRERLMARERERLLVQCREHVAGRQDQVLLAVDLDLGAAVLRVDHDVADLHVEPDAAVAVLVPPAGAGGHDGALLRLLLGRVRDHEARRGGLVTLVRLDDDPVLERLELEVRHLLGPSFYWSDWVPGTALALPGPECSQDSQASPSRQGSLHSVAMSDRYEQVTVRSRPEWRRWLAYHHNSCPGVWAVTYKKDSAGPSVPYSSIVEEALCFGWIDSTRK